MTLLHQLTSWLRVGIIYFCFAFPSYFWRTAPKYDSFSLYFPLPLACILYFPSLPKSVWNICMAYLLFNQMELCQFPRYVIICIDLRISWNKEENLTFQRTQSRGVTDFRTGYNPLRSNLHLMGLDQFFLFYEMLGRGWNFRPRFVWVASLGFTRAYLSRLLFLRPMGY